MKNLLITLLVSTFLCISAGAQTTAFTYQGSLKDGATAASGNYDFQFALYDAVSGGTQLGSTLTRNSIVVANGIFSVSLDFGTQFPGANRFLEIRVRLTGQPSLTTLTPRQPVNSEPYAIKSLFADNLGGLPATGFIQNGTALQTASQNISGNAFFGGQVGIGTTSLSGSKLTVIGGSSVGVHGESSSLSGVDGFSSSGKGVYGESPTGIGVHGLTSSGIGVYGSGGPSGKAGFFNGPVNVWGRLIVGTNVDLPDALSLYTPTTNYGFVHTDGVVSVGSFVGGTNGGGWYGTKSSHPLSLFAGASGAALTITTAGRVGIGTLTPTDKLNVQTATTNYGFTHTDGTVIVGSFVGGSTGGGYYGTKTNHSLSLFANNGPPSLTISTDGLVNIPIMASAGGGALCRNGPAIAFCSSSLRYKTNIGKFDQGLSLLNKLRPITFDWKHDGVHDLGFGAEDVEKIEPLLVTYNDKGQVEGVKYDRLSVVFVNAFKEQQGQIEALQKTNAQQQKQNDELKKEVDALKVVVCSIKADAEICKADEKNK